MAEKTFGWIALLIGLAFAIYFFAFVFPPAIASGDMIGAFAAGFVNPYAAGYATDTILCGVILVVWILFERTRRKVPFWWTCLPLSLIPGVATAFGLYLFLRSRSSPIGAD